MLISLALVIIFIFAPFINGASVYAAADLSSTYNLITGVSITDWDGNPLGNNIPKNTSIRIAYTYAIPNQGDVMEGDSFSFMIPSQVKIDAPGDFEMRDSANQLIANGTLATDGKVTFTFTNYAQTHSNVSGTLWFNLYFDESKIGLDDPTIITFSLGGTSAPVTISIDFDQPAPLPTSIEKTGSYNAVTNQITWTVKVNKENVVVRNGVVEDTIAAGLEFVAGSLTIGGVAAKAADYTYDAGSAVLSYHFPAMINAQQTLTFKTEVKDSEFSNAAEGTILNEKNSAVLRHDGIATLSNEAVVPVTVDFISKTGTFNAATKRIDWTIVVNKNLVTIPDAVILDTLPAGLTLYADSITVDNVAFAAYSYTYPDITMNLGLITGKHTIKFSTDVEASAFTSNTAKNYKNICTLSGTGVPATATANATVGAATNLVRKTNVSYNQATGEITWRVTVNSNQISVINPVITDQIKNGQEYVAGSATINNTVPGGVFTYTPATAAESATITGTLAYTFNTTITGTYIIEFRTRVTNPNVYAGNTTGTNYTNTAVLLGDNITRSTSTGTQTVVSNVVNKTGAGYDYTTRVVSWSIVVNNNQMTLTHAVITDNIPKGMEYVPGSASIDSDTTPTGFSYAAADPGDAAKSGTLTYTFPASITSRYTITFQTRITDVSIFQTNGDKTITNSAWLKHDLISAALESKGTQTVKNTVISKEASYTPGKKYIDWTVNVNANEIPLSNAVIRDVLQEGLALDTVSVRLFHQTVDANSNYIAGSEITLTGANVVYDAATRIFTFNLPTPASGGYKLLFRTNITDKTKSPFTNQVTFNGTGSVNNSTSTPTNVSWAGSGSTGTGEVGSITLLKADAANHAKLLAGASFDLIDKYGNVVLQGTTDAAGSYVFENLRFDVPYTIKEITAPTGYNISLPDYTFTISGVAAVKDITYVYEDTAIYGNIQFIKLGVQDLPLEGASFTLYDHNNQSVGTVESGSDGKVLFEHVPYGNYTIRETNPPEGYLLSTTVLTATVLLNNVTVTANPVSLSNQIIKGNVKVTKTADDKETLLSGATFTIYAASDTDMTSPIAVSVTGKDGIALFTDIPYGIYIVKETIPPAGYMLSTETRAVSVTQDTWTYDLGIFTDTLISTTPGSVIQIKKVGEDGITPLAKATFSLFAASDTAFTVPITATVSGDDGIARFVNIPVGSYVVKETAAPQGYQISTEVFNVSIANNGEIYNTGTCSDRKIRGDIEIYKTNDRNEPLAGASFVLKDLLGNQTAESTSGINGIARFTNIVYGTYTITEVQAPASYSKSDAVLTAEIKENGAALKFTVVNQKSDADVMGASAAKPAQPTPAASVGDAKDPGEVIGANRTINGAARTGESDTVITAAGTVLMLSGLALLAGFRRKRKA